MFLLPGYHDGRFSDSNQPRPRKALTTEYLGSMANISQIISQSGFISAYSYEVTNCQDITALSRCNPSVVDYFRKLWTEMRKLV